jgi:hypothetical protein
MSSDPGPHRVEVSWTDPKWYVRRRLDQLESFHEFHKSSRRGCQVPRFVEKLLGAGIYARHKRVMVHKQGCAITLRMRWR